jgi:hypothetical protein
VRPIKDDEGNLFRPARSDREIASLIPRPTGERCQLHGSLDCSPCRYLAESLQKYKDNPEAPSEFAYPTQVSRRAEAAPGVIVPRPTPEELKRLEDNARNFFEIPVDADQSATAVPLRYFYQPLPRGSVHEWPTDPERNGAAYGMTPLNIAMFLMMPEFIYSKYEQNKANPPRRIFVTAEESIERPYYKQPDSLRAPSEKEKDWGVTHVGSEIVRRAEPIEIHIPAVAAQQQLRKAPPPAVLLEALRQAKADHQMLKARHIKSLDEAARLSKKESASARTRSLRKVHRLEAEIASFQQRRLLDVPNTGHAAIDIVIPPCPEGSHELFEKVYLRQYIQGAFESPEYRRRINWDYYWTNFENKVIRRAHVLNLIRGWPNPRANAEWWADGRPSPSDQAFKERYGWYASQSDAQNEYLVDVDRRARDAALSNYRRGEGGMVADESIRRVGPGTVGGWHGAGAGPSSDERGDSYDFRWDRDIAGRTGQSEGDGRKSAGSGSRWDPKK